MAKYTDREIEVIKTYYPDGGVRGVQKLINRTGNSIRHKAKSLGVKTCEDFKDNKVDFSNLMLPSSPEDAYILGILWGDGHLGQRGKSFTISLTLKDTDFSEIHNLFSKWNFYVVNNKDNISWNTCYMAHIGHKKLGHFLYTNDYLNKSSVSPFKILNIIPNNIKKYFFRGYFDADGHSKIVENKGHVSISSGYNQDWSFMRDLCDSLGIDYRVSLHIYEKDGKIYKSSTFHFNSIRSSIRFLSYIYSDKIFGLSRKHNSFLIFKSNINKKFLSRKTKPKGVRKEKGKTYSANITINSKNYYLGSARSLLEAAKIYDKKCWEIYKDETMLNYPEDYIKDYSELFKI